ncbi:hypothetical protein E2C01_092591 [Portunus trituberculatus]|uniref:Uncharacterized protein n=1 Tax=Portunus trituberculatus TaxID=210409 RepID=A0A5B7JSG1_PORTR|nr:hypothetical protein [Portunus trituberculatus]
MDGDGEGFLCLSRAGQTCQPSYPFTHSPRHPSRPPTPSINSPAPQNHPSCTIRTTQASREGQLWMVGPVKVSGKVGNTDAPLI